MVFSYTSPLPETGPGTRTDTLYDAWQALRRAREIPFEASTPLAWRQRFRESIEQAWHGLSAHIRESDRAGRTAPASEAVRLAARLLELLGSADAATQPSVHDFVDLGERTVELEMLVARHRNRLGANSTPAGRRLDLYGDLEGEHDETNPRSQSPARNRHRETGAALR